MGLLNAKALTSLGFASIGRDVRVSTLASFHGASRIHLGDNVRIDDFCVLSAGEGGIYLGSHIHIAVYSCMIGAGRITLDDFANVSSRVAIYSSNDDYSGGTMTNPTVPDKFKDIKHADVYIGRHVIIGSGSVVLPGAVLEDGVAVGAMSMMRGHCPSFGIYAGVPARRIRERSRGLLDLEQRFLSEKTEGT